MPKPITFSHEHAHLDQLAERSLVSYIDELKRMKKEYGVPESFLNCPTDARMRKDVRDMVGKKTSPALRFVVVIGIGGSYLATKAVYEAMVGRLDAHTDTYPKMLFLDTVSARAMMDVVEILSTQAESKQQFLINVVTKSGATTETIANMETLCHALETRFGTITDRIVVTTDKDSKLWKAAGKKRIARLPIPVEVGGRYSAFTAVGQFPLACVGIDVTALLRGAADMNKRCIQKKNNPATQSAAILFHYRVNDIRIHSAFFFNPEMESMGKWYRQLMAESIGKRENDMGTVVHEGIIPTVAIGSIDLHSMAQLTLGGPRSFLTTFIYAKQLPTQVKVPKKLLMGTLVKHINEASYKKIMEAIFEGVKSAYDEHELPYMETHIPEINEYTLGQFMQWKMCETMFLGRLLNINAFNQPNVEDYKKVTRKLLSVKQ